MLCLRLSLRFHGVRLLCLCLSLGFHGVRPALSPPFAARFHGAECVSSLPFADEAVVATIAERRRWPRPAHRLRLAARSWTATTKTTTAGKSAGPRSRRCQPLRSTGESSALALHGASGRVAPLCPAACLLISRSCMAAPLQTQTPAGAWSRRQALSTTTGVPRAAIISVALGSYWFAYSLWSSRLLAQPSCAEPGGAAC